MHLLRLHSFFYSGAKPIAFDSELRPQKREFASNCVNLREVASNCVYDLIFLLEKKFFLELIRNLSEALRQVALVCVKLR